MKKIFASIAVIAICISFASCNKTKSHDITNDIQAESSAEITQTHNEQAEKSEEKTTQNIVDETNENEVITQKPLNDKIHQVKKPSWLLDGMEEVEGLNSRVLVNSDYYIGDVFYFTFTQRPIAIADINVDNEGANVTDINISGYNGVIITYDNHSVINLFWSDADYAYSICSELLTYEEAMRIAESVDFTN